MLMNKFFSLNLKLSKFTISNNAEKVLSKLLIIFGKRNLRVFSVDLKLVAYSDRIRISLDHKE